MENLGVLILDISSDEEVGFGGPNKGDDGFGEGGFLGRDDCEWLAEILGEVGGTKGDDDYRYHSDDIILISETFQNPPKKLRRDPLKPFGKSTSDEDDDCVVLEGDPDKPVMAAAAAAAETNGVKVDDNDGDEVEIVAEKGEVACRDFPHARHLCAKFLFASTAHDIHCSQCHCYVCDSVAPCPHWGTGASSIDHCHATDKNEYWRAERKRAKKGPNSGPAVPLVSNTPHPGPPFPDPIWAPNMLSFRRPAAFPAHQVQAHVASINKPQPQAGPQSTIVNKNPILERQSGHRLGSQMPRNDPMRDFKKMPKRRCSLPSAQAMHYATCQRSTGTYCDSRPVNIGRPSCGPSRNPVNPVPYVINDNFVSGMTCQPSLGNKIDNLNFPPIHVLQPRTNNFGNAYKNYSGSRFMILPDESLGNNSVNQYSQPQAPFGIPVGFQEVSHAVNHRNSSLNDVNSQVFQLQSVGLAVDNYEFQGVVMNDGSQIKGPASNFQQGVLADNPQFPESIINCNALDFLCDSWIFENHSLQGGMEVPGSPLWSAFSSEPDSVVEAGKLFDI